MEKYNNPSIYLLVSYTMGTLVTLSIMLYGDARRVVKLLRIPPATRMYNIFPGYPTHSYMSKNKKSHKILGILWDLKEDY